jgi:translation initiation factor 3 subunit A
MQYKNVAQAVDVNSIQLVVSKFIGLADAKVADAIAHSTQQSAALDVDDLEASETPESILLGAVSAANQTRERTDRVLVTPWLKFLWETYRTSLEVLKNSTRLEAIYQQVARQAFQFCITHTRKVEFRRLCETLRLHLSNVTKYAPPPGSTQTQHANAINLNDPAVLQSHLDTRLVQLQIAVELECMSLSHFTFRTIN